jgi:hypothetical protein
VGFKSPIPASQFAKVALSISGIPSYRPASDIVSTGFAIRAKKND